MQQALSRTDLDQPPSSPRRPYNNKIVSMVVGHVGLDPVYYGMHDNTNPMALPPDAGEAICSSRESQVIADHALASQLHIAGTNQSRPGLADPRIWSSMGFGAWTSYNLRIKISPDVPAATPVVQSAVSSHRASWRKGLNIRHPELRRSPARLYLCTRVLLSNIRDPPSGWPLSPAGGLVQPRPLTHQALPICWNRRRRSENRARAADGAGGVALELERTYSYVFSSPLWSSDE